MEGGSQGPPHSMCYLVAVALSVWVPVEDWEAVDGSLDSTEKALQVVSSRLPEKVASATATGTMGWMFLIALKACMESALHDGVQVHKLQRWEEELEPHTLEQEMCGLDEPSAMKVR